MIKLNRNKNNAALSHTEARKLTEAFMAGDTTLEQEQQLYAYYNSSDIAPDLEEFRPLMTMLASASTQHTFRAKGKLLWVKILSAAAAVTLVISVFTYFLTSSQPNNDDYDRFAEIYGNSYVIRNGKRVTDKEEVRQSVMNIDLYTDLQEQALDYRLQAAERAWDEGIEAMYPDDHTRALVKEFISE